jgi:hypothetical protein
MRGKGRLMNHAVEVTRRIRPFDVVDDRVKRLVAENVLDGPVLGDDVDFGRLARVYECRDIGVS